MAGLDIYHYGARFYSPKLGRFLSADTIVPGAANPQAYNRYSYVLGNPLRYTDPTGHYCVGDDEDCADEAGNGPAPSGNSGGNNGNAGGGGDPHDDDDDDYDPNPNGLPGSPECYPGELVCQIVNNPGPSWTTVYTTTIVTNSLGGEVPPVYGGWNLHWDSRFLIQPYGFSLDPEYADGRPVSEPLTVLHIPAINGPPQYEILVNTTTTTTTVVYDPAGKVIGASTVVESNSELMTPYWQNNGPPYDFPSSWNP